jgi:hypothetical protein
VTATTVGRTGNKVIAAGRVTAIIVKERLGF